jgi:hypothetical protein
VVLASHWLLFMDQDFSLHSKHFAHNLIMQQMNKLLEFRTKDARRLSRARALAVFSSSLAYLIAYRIGYSW